MKQLALEISPDTVPTLDNFVPGRNDELLHALVNLVAGLDRFVYLWGEDGGGKSHLLRACVAAGRGKGLSAVYVAEGNHLSADLADQDLVAVDDVDRLDGEAQIALFNLYNRMKEGNGRLLVAGPCAPARLGLRPDVVTRLGWGLVYQVQGLSDAEKAEALKGHARQLGFDLPNDAADYLLKHWRRDLPSLLAAVDALDRYSLEHKRPVTVPLLRQLLQQEGA
jgi:DnaA family protein